MALVRRGGLIVLLGLGLGLPGPTPRAQEVPSPAAPTSHEGWGFVDRSPRPGRRFADVAVHPKDPALLLAVTQGGTAWLSADGGGTWFPVLEADAARLGELSPDEPIRQQIEAELDDVLDDQGIGDLDDLMSEEGYDEETAAEVAADLAQEAAQAVASQVQTEMEADPGFLVDQAAVDLASRDFDPLRARGWVTADDRLFVSRGDGLLLSSDLGATWDMVLGEPVTALAPLAGGLVAGTREGFWTSPDGLRWEPVFDRADAVEVLDLVLVGDALWAATSSGVRSSVDGVRWEPVGLLAGKVRALAVDGAGTAWAAFDRGVLVSNDGGVTFREPPEPPPQGVVDLLALGPGLVMAAGPEGPFESVDGGATWTRVEEGLLGGGAWALADAGGRLWLASDQGLSLLEPPDVIAMRAAALGSLPEFVAFEALVGEALTRDGLGETMPRSARFTSTALPRLHVEGRYVRSDALSYLDSQGTTRDEGGVFTVFAWLQWTPAGRSTGSVDVLIADGEVIVDDGGDRMMLAARMDRRAAVYRAKVAEIVTELYYRRAMLVAERALRRSDPLVVRVGHEIAIQEVEAQLDVFTDGAVSAWRANGAE